MKTLFTVLLSFLAIVLSAQCDPTVSLSVSLVQVNGDDLDVLIHTEGSDFGEIIFMELIVSNTNCATSYDIPALPDLPDFSEALECTVANEPIEVQVVYYGGNFYPCMSETIIIPVDGLPVELIEWKVTKKGTDALLEWTTASEENNLEFEMQHSVDGKVFKSIGFVDGQGTSDLEVNYQYLDRNTVSGKNYYRLIQYDFDGRFEVFDIKVVNFEQRVHIYPNPTTEVLFVDLPKGNHFVSIIDDQGRLMQSMNIRDKERINVENLEMGVYFLRIENKVLRFIKK